MKLVALLFLTIFVSQTFSAPASHAALRTSDRSLSGLEFAAEGNESLEEVQKQLRERLDKILEKIKAAIDQGKGIKEDLLTKVKELKEKMKDMKIGKKGQDILDKIRDNGGDFFKKILEKFGFGRRSADIDVFGMIDQLKELIREKYNPEKLRQFVEKYLGKEGAELANQLVSAVREKDAELRRKKIEELLDRVLVADRGERRSIKDTFQKIKSYFEEELGIQLKEKHFKFGEWVKEKRILGNGRNKLDNVKRIAEDFLEETMEVSRVVAREALNFFSEYREELGNRFLDIKAKVDAIMN